MTQEAIQRSARHSLGRLSSRRVTITTYEEDAASDGHTSNPRQETANSPYENIPYTVRLRNATVVSDEADVDVDYAAVFSIPDNAGPVEDDVLAGVESTGLYPSRLTLEDGREYSAVRVFDSGDGTVEVYAE